MEWDRLVLRLGEYVPTQAWAQTLVGVGALVLVALVAQWVGARIVLACAHRLLVLTDRENWDKALRRRRAYHNFWYAVPFAVVSVGIGLVSHEIGRASCRERVCQYV